MIFFCTFKFLQMEMKNGGAIAFSPIDKENVSLADTAVMRRHSVEDKSSSSTTVKSIKEESTKDKESRQTTKRKQRRCWSPELHRRFIHSLQHLGGPHGKDFVGKCFLCD